jgi:hypothetical protein
MKQLQCVEISIGQVLTACNRWQDKRDSNDNVRIMAALLENCTREKQRSVIKFLQSEGVKPWEIHRRMIQQYGGSCMSERKVYQWVERFQEGQTSVVDEHRSGCPCTAVSDANVARMGTLIGENRQISVDTVATMLNISIGTAHGIIHENIKYCYLCSRWVLSQLTDEHRLKRVRSCRAFLTR